MRIQVLEEEEETTTTKKKKSSSSSEMPAQELQPAGLKESQEKTQPNEAGGGGGKTLVVGFKMEADSRELLTWALVKHADAGDRVVALHILPLTPPDASEDGLSCSYRPLLSLIKEFDAMLAVYEGFCNLKKVELKMKIARGLSVRKVLVREAISYRAGKLVVGVSKNDRGIGCSFNSVAKYCARKLPQDCSVYAVSNGKTVFKREASAASRLVEDKKTHNEVKIITTAYAGGQTLYRSYPKLRNARTRPSNLNKSSSVFCEIIERCDGSATQGILTVEAKEQRFVMSDKDPSLALVPERKPEPASASSSSISLLFHEEDSPGWPLLRKLVSPDTRAVPADGLKNSVLQWAMRLPSRFSAASTVHPDSKPMHSHFVEEEREFPKELEHLRDRCLSVCRLFSYDELAHMTSGFSPDKLIGKGGSSHVYKGCLSDGKELAVKILKPSVDVMNEFVTEIEIMTSLHHKNIVSLVGFCIEEGNLMLVYNFLPRGSLEDNLHGDSLSKNYLGWSERYKVAVGIAEALNYLHGASNAQPVIHRDVKSSNILLSEDFEPLLADFGLAKWASLSTSQLICSDVAGTFGYLAPEYFMYGKVNEKIDVYAFGVVLLELLSGRKPVSTSCPKGQESLVLWAMPILQGGEVKELLDPRLRTSYNEAQLECIILAISLCIKRASRSRPHITFVLKLLKGDDEVLRLAKSQVQNSKESEGLDDEGVFGNNDIQSHIALALEHIKDGSSSGSGIEPPIASLSLKRIG
ncbi:probable receptor-like serine/threonine-protein kinase At5g57670 [Zingiber officinale]|nr:probable receptor-like serine/threonine-protein kinase At5g57670 [Zingiber officinale]